MSFNRVMPQFAALTPEGRVVLVPSNYFTQGLSYVQVPHALQHPQIPHQLSPIPPRQIEAAPPITLPSPIIAPQPKTQSTPKIQPAPLSIEQTNARIRSIKEKCISHYIEGQLIIETFKPLMEKKPKKKKSHPQQPRQQKEYNHNQQQQQQQQHQQQQKQQRQVAIPPQFKQQAIQPQPMEIDPQQSQPPPPPPPPQLQAQKQLPSQQQQLQTQQQQPTPSQHQPKPSVQPPKQTATKQGQPQKRQQPNQQQQRQQPPDLKKLRAEMENWSVSDVVKFIERHEEIRECSAKFAEDEIDGSALLFMIDRNLNFQTSNILTSMFKIGPAMKIEAILSKYKINE